MASFREHMQADAVAILDKDEAAEDLIYTAQGVAPLPVRGVVEEMPVLDEGPAEMPRTYRAGLGEWTRIMLPRASVAACPAYLDKVARADDPDNPWTIQQAGPEGAMWSCWAERGQRIGSRWQARML